MSRPNDWWVLDLERDPTPGNPWSVRGLARSWDGLADDAEAAERGVRSLIGDGAVLSWVGAAGEVFREAVGEFPGQLEKCKTSYRLGAAALTAWASDLDGVQRDADHALALGREARADLQAATAALGAAQGVAGSAGSSSTRLSELAEKYADSPPPSGVTVPTREQVQAAQRNAAAAQARVRSAQADVSSAQSRLDAARRMALEAKALRESRGKVAAERIHDASDAGIPPNSFWEDVKDVAAKVWDVVIVIAKVVVLVLGVVALIIGGPLAWVVFAAGVLLLADALMKYLQGQGSLWDVAFAALGCIPGVRGLTTLGELATAFRSGATVLRGLLASGRVILGAAKTTVLGMAQAVRALGSGLRTIGVALRDGTRLFFAEDAGRYLSQLNSGIPVDAVGGWAKRVGQAVGQERALQRVDALRRDLNHLTSHLTMRDLDAARRELAGEIVALKSTGQPWNHVHEVQDAQRGVMDAIARINKQLGHPGTTEAVRDALNEQLARASKLLDFTEQFVPRP